MTSQPPITCDVFCNERGDGSGWGQVYDQGVKLLGVWRRDGFGVGRGEGAIGPFVVPMAYLLHICTLMDLLAFCITRFATRRTLQFSRACAHVEDAEKPKHVPQSRAR